MPLQTEQLNHELGALQEELQKLKTAVEEIEKAKEAALLAVKIAEKVLKEFSLLAQETNRLLVEIERIDFPSRLDKIDASITGINQGIQNVLSKLENIGHIINLQFSNIQKQIENSEKKLMEQIESTRKNVLVLQTEQRKGIKFIKAFVIIITLFCLGITIFMIFR